MDARPSMRPLLPKVPWPVMPNSPVGRLVRTFSEPPMVFLPNSVPCGPRRISIDSKSKKSISEPMLRPMNTPSTITPTAGSKLDSTSWKLMPRMEKKVALVNAPPESRTTLGATPARSRKSWAKDFCNAVSLNALTATGTCCRFSARLRAVTTISSMTTPRSCARARPASPTSHAPHRAVVAKNTAFRVILFLPTSI